MTHDLGDTRSHILKILLKYGPVTASDLAERLNLSAAGVRRHLDILTEEGLAEITKRKTGGGRGRPAKYFRLTDAGRATFGHGYDHLAGAALDALRDVGGSDAVRNFAQRRIEEVVGGIDAADASDESIEETTRRLAEAFDKHGYAVTVTRAGQGIQLCHHHCPISSVAAENPELCEAEHQVISSKVGLHIQPLASIVDGHGICTTNIPLHALDQTLNERSES
ncbi:helix-turn-helix transcriptional regulator [Corynebacterium uterequi]|uniref:Putative transcriptional regulator n=1 Tax=Corynebacterium uterequi TaxID=1072256 RepID=A0A0G3HCZ7_9CORY|nr:metalloregulator ArsR/SmtB family transcription factor [Corynebacterium uterequi]AKK11149.1 putative transcriptional regulator [Corynebacterium uterequi]